MNYFDADAVGSRLALTLVQERRHGPRVSRSGKRFLVTVISLSAQQLENSSSPAGDCASQVATIEFEVFKLRFASRCCLLESTPSMGGVSILYGDKVICSTKVRMLRRKSMRGSKRK